VLIDSAGPSPERLTSTTTDKRFQVGTLTFQMTVAGL
jgi:hypothetical protein